MYVKNHIHNEIIKLLYLQRRETTNEIYDHTILYWMLYIHIYIYNIYQVTKKNCLTYFVHDIHSLHH